MSFLVLLYILPKQLQDLGLAVAMTVGLATMVITKEEVAMLDAPLVCCVFLSIHANSNSHFRLASGMSTGGKAALSLFFIALAAGIVAGVYFYRKNGNLLGYTISSSGIQKSTNHDSSRKAGDYVAYEDKL